MNMAVKTASVNKITITCVLYDEIYFDFSCSKNLHPTAVYCTLLYTVIL